MSKSAEEILKEHINKEEGKTDLTIPTLIRAMEAYRQQDMVDCPQSHGNHNLDVMHLGCCTKCGKTNIIPTLPIGGKGEKSFSEDQLRDFYITYKGQRDAGGTCFTHGSFMEFINDFTDSLNPNNNEQTI